MTKYKIIIRKSSYFKDLSLTVWAVRTCCIVGRPCFMFFSHAYWKKGEAEQEVKFPLLLVCFSSLALTA